MKPTSSLKPSLAHWYKPPSSGIIRVRKITTTADGTSSWGSNGAITTGTTLVTANDDYYEFAINTTGVTSVTLNFDALEKTPNGPKGLAVFFGTTTKPAGTSEPAAAILNNSNALPTQNTWATFGPITVNSGLNPSGLTFFRIYPFNSGSHYDLISRLLSIVVLGGLGSLGGAVIAALVMGVTEAVVAVEWKPTWASFSYFIVLPRAVHWLTSFDSKHFVHLVAAKAYYSFVVTIMLGMTLVFELPRARLCRNAGRSATESPHAASSQRVQPARAHLEAAVSRRRGHGTAQALLRRSAGRAATDRHLASRAPPFFGWSEVRV